MKKSRLVDFGRVLKCEERFNKDGKVFYIVIVDGYNAVYRLFNVDPFDEDQLVLVFEREDEKGKRLFVKRCSM